MNSLISCGIRLLKCSKWKFIKCQDDDGHLKRVHDYVTGHRANSNIEVFNCDGDGVTTLINLATKGKYQSICVAN